ncbi:MAG: hypothetical protein U5N86_03440 [Planctomycetota bacterium]|nr:hypothetical protein [Planctomycetota bacterium]
MYRYAGLALAMFLLVLIAVPQPSFAEDQQGQKKGYADYEYEFGINLISYNFWKLAEEHFNNYLKDTKIPADKRVKGHLGLAILWQERGKTPILPRRSVNRPFPTLYRISTSF